MIRKNVRIAGTCAFYDVTDHIKLREIHQAIFNIHWQTVEKQPAESRDGRPKSMAGVQVVDFVSKSGNAKSLQSS